MQFYQGPLAAVAVLWPFYQVLSTMAALSRSRTRPMAAMAVVSIRSDQMARSVRFGLRMADFILPRIRSLSAAKPSHFYQVWQSDRPFYEGRLAAVAVLSKPMAILSRPASLSSSFSNSGRFIKGQWPQWPFITKKRPQGQIC